MNNTQPNQDIPADEFADENSQLLSYQLPHKLQMHEALTLRNRCIDGSDTGTGKTYSAVAECKTLGLRPFVICPKSVLTVWIDVCKKFNVELFGISNYEMLKNCRYYTSDLEPTVCPYMDKVFEEKKEKDAEKKPRKKGELKTKHIEQEPVLTEKEKVRLARLKTFDKNYQDKIIDDEENLVDDIEDELLEESDNEKKPKKKKNQSNNTRYEFYLPDDVIVIFDEAHRCKNINTQTSKLLLGLAKCKNKILILSATITDKLKCFKPFGMFFNFYGEPSQFSSWIKNQMRLNSIKYKNKPYTEDQIKLDIIHNKIYPQYGSRMKIAELGDLFPQNNIIAQCYYLENHIEVEKLYAEINDALISLACKEFMAEVLPALIYCRQKLEMLKVPIFMDLAREGLTGGYAIVIFVNYLETLNYLCYHLKDEAEEYGGIALVMGGQTIEERQANVEDFQQNKKRMTICMMQAGGVGISLHDLYGIPRMSIISPSWTSIDVKQALGRIHRAGAKTPAIQKLVYVAKTYEEEICKLIKSKFSVMDALNDGDLIGKEIPKDVLEELEKPPKVDEQELITKEMQGETKVDQTIINVPIDMRVKQVKKKQFKKSNKDTKKLL
jgi:superfamily II DNA or RNA helicase